MADRACSTRPFPSPSSCGEDIKSSPIVKAHLAKSQDRLYNVPKMRRKLLLSAALTLVLGASGVTTYAMLKPVLAPAAPVAAAAQAPPPLVPVRNPRKHATDFQAGVIVLIYGNDPT